MPYDVSEGTYVDVVQLIVVGVVLGNRVGRGRRECVVVGDVRREAPHVLGRAGALVQVREELRRGCEVGGPTEPAGVASIKVHVDANAVELLYRVRDASLVRGRSAGALRDVHVRDKVRERVGLDDSDDGDVGVLLDHGDDLVDVALVLVETVVRN